MSSTWGNVLKLSIFGESHGPAIGMVLDGLPAGEAIDLDAVQVQMERRAPGLTAGSTPRREADLPHFVSGMLDGKLTGAPLCAVIENTNVKSHDYTNILHLPRPSHADYTGSVRYGGHNDIRGGGHFSGRLTAPLTAAGAVCRQILEKRGIVIGSHVFMIHNIYDMPFDAVSLTAEELNALNKEPFTALDLQKKREMYAEIARAQAEKDSVGGIIECAAVGLPAGIGSPMFDSLESRIASLLYGVPAVKGVSFGDGFGISGLCGSEANDSMYYASDGSVKTRTNHNGGILGGISTGMPLLLRVAFKPTASIAKEQQTIDCVSHENASLVIKGRHDACIAVRAQPVVEAAVAVALLDAMLIQGEVTSYGSSKAQ